MPRTTVSAVQGVLGVGTPVANYDGMTDLTPFIATASAIVDRVATLAAKKRKPLSDAELELVERWLAAHYYCQMDQPFTSKSTSGASASFQGKTDMSIEGTKYGQTALNLDYSGALTVIGKRLVASVQGPARGTGWCW